MLNLLSPGSFLRSGRSSLLGPVVPPPSKYQTTMQRGAATLSLPSLSFFPDPLVAGFHHPHQSVSATRFPVELPLARCGGQYAGSRGEFQPVGGVGPRVGAARRWPPPASLRWVAVRKWTPPASHGVEAAAPRRVGEFFFLLFPVKCFLQIFSRFLLFQIFLHHLFHTFCKIFSTFFCKILSTKTLQKFVSQSFCKICSTKFLKFYFGNVFFHLNFLLQKLLTEIYFRFFNNFLFQKGF